MVLQLVASSTQKIILKIIKEAYYTEKCNRSVTCDANDSDPNRCLVRLFQTYLRHRPADNQNFYLTPLQKTKGDIWYTNMPVGHNTLSRIVTKLCKKAGIPGYKTNHSL